MTATPNPHIFDRALLRRRRCRFAGRARDHDFLMVRVADDFVERLSVVKRTFSRIAIVGAHPGIVAEKLARLYPDAMIIECDSGPSLLAGRAHASVVCDEEALPFADQSLDLIVSPLALQHVNDVPGVLAQMRRSLKPDGLLLASLLGGETLKELRASWLEAEADVTGGASPRVAPFADVRALGALLQRAGFALPVVDSDTVIARYASPLAVIRDVRGMGASNVLNDRRRVPVTKGLLMRALDIYGERTQGSDGRVPATFEIVTLTGWCPHESQQTPLRPGSAAMRLADALGVPELGSSSNAPGTKGTSGM
ncbi:MAG: methyltransferase domain-containing protein [Hyphomicrobium sp.]